MAGPLPEKPDSSLGGGSDEIQLKDIYYILLEKLWIVGLSLVVFLMAAGLYVLKSPTLYTSLLVLEMEPKEQKVINIDGVSQEDLSAKDSISTFAQNLKTRVVFERIVEKGKLLQDKAFLDPLPDGPYNEKSLVGLLTGRVTIEPRKGTRLLDVKVDHEDPAVAQNLANLLIAQALRLRIEQRAGAAAIASEFLRDEAEKLKIKLNASEIHLQEYQEKLGTVSLMERQNTVTQKLKELNQSLTEVKAARIQMDSQLKEAEKNQGNAQSMQTLASGDPASLAIRNQISQQEALIGNLLQRYKEKHPKMIQARSQLNELKESLAGLVSPERLKSSYATALAKEKNFEEALKEQEKEALDLNRKAIEYNVLLREMETDRSVYESVIKRIRETDLTQNLETTDVKIIEPASLAGSPSKPKTLLIFAVAGVAGVLIGVMLAFGLHFLDDSFKTVDQVESKLGLPVLGALPVTVDADESEKGERDRLYVEENPNTPLVEAFRSLRATLGLLGPEGERKTFLFTSAVPEEGKSFVCANLGLLFAHQNFKTLLIDADLRKPRLSSIFGLNQHPAGLAAYLVAKGKLKQMVVDTGRDNLWILPAGSRVPNPSELLSGPAFAELLKEASENYDRVIVDTAPIHAVSDTLLLVSLVQSVCLVVRAAKTPRNAVSRAIEMISRSRVRPVGIVMNRLPKNKGVGYYYYYSHYQGYGDKVYGVTAAVKRK